MSEMAETNELADAVAEAVVARLNTVSALAFDYITVTHIRMHVPGQNAAMPLVVDIFKGDTTLTVRLADPNGTILCQFVYGREQSGV